MEIGLVSCTKQKRDSASVPRELYSASPYFRKASQYAESTHDKWYILSAKHGLLSPQGAKIRPYDETLSMLSVEQRQQWAEEVFADLREQKLINPATKFVIHAGRDYYEMLLPLLEETDTAYEIPTEGLRFGEKLRWYNDNIPEVSD